MAFKIKTTSPKQYFVRPNQGLIKAGDRQIIHVMMGKVSEVPKTPCKDRFLVQSSPYDGEPTDKFEWKSHFNKDHKCHERKLSCKYITDDVREPTTERPSAEPNKGEGVRQRPPPASKPDKKDDAAAAAPVEEKKPAPVPEKAPTSPGPTTVTPVAPAAPASSSGMQISMFLVLAILMFLVGRYTTHVALPGSE
jgi:hypothetical protein